MAPTDRDLAPREIAAAPKRSAKDKPERSAEDTAEIESLQPLPILFRDQHLIVVSKPAGIQVHRSDQDRSRNVVLQRVREMVGSYVYPVMRLDRGTSGIIALGLSSEAAAALQKSLQRPDATKRYLVLARGNPKGDWTSVRPLRDAKDRPQPCRTTFRVLRRLPRCSLLEAELHTGRYHQIRRHLNHAGHHLIGDTTHGKGVPNRWARAHLGLNRMFLHAARLSFRHPVTGQAMELRDPLPENLRAPLEKLTPMDRGWLAWL